MAFNGSGTFQRLYNWQNDADANIPITDSRMDAEFDGIATGLSNCITKDGQTTITSNLPMSTYRHTGVGNATARDSYAAAGQVQDGSLHYATESGTANAKVMNLSPAPTAYITGGIYRFKVAVTNTGSATINVNSLGAKTIKKNISANLAAGDLTAQDMVTLVYDGTNMQLVSKSTVASVQSQDDETDTTTAGDAYLVFNTATSKRQAMGWQTLSSYSGTNGTGFGSQVAKDATSGGNIAGFGGNALFSLTTGAQAVGIGPNAAYSFTTGSGITACGTSTLYNATGNGNAGFGTSTGLGVTTTGNNAFFGESCVTTGSDPASCCVFGSNSDLHNSSSNVNVFGQGITAAASSNTSIIGDSSVQYTILRGSIQSDKFRNTISDTATISTNELRDGLLYQDASSGSVTMTTETGTNIDSAFPELAQGANGAIDIYVASNHATNTSTISGGTGVTLVGSGAVTNTGGHFILVRTGSATFDLVRVG